MKFYLVAVLVIPTKQEFVLQLIDGVLLVRSAMYLLGGGSNRPEALMFWWLLHSWTSSVSWLRCRWHVADLHNEEITHDVCLSFTWWRESLRNLSWEGRQTASHLLSFNPTTFSSFATHNTQTNKSLKSCGRQVDWVVGNKWFCLKFQDENIPKHSMCLFTLSRSCNWIHVIRIFADVTTVFLTYEVFSFCCPSTFNIRIQVKEERQ